MQKQATSFLAIKKLFLTPSKKFQFQAYPPSTPNILLKILLDNFYITYKWSSLFLASS